MEKILTISIAAYGVEDYIRETLDSLIVPEILDELEVFVVDDGSRDGTLAIAKEYEDKYPNTFHAVHKKNGGYGTTVDWSIQHATGRYFKLLDGDDWFDSNNLEEFVARLKVSDADAIVSDTIEAHDGGESFSRYPFLTKLDGQVRSIVSAAQDPVVAMWAYTFKTALVKEKQETLPMHTIYTDQLFVIHSLSAVRNIEYYGKPIYYWRIGRDEQSNSMNSIRKHYKDIMHVADMINRYFDEKCDYKNEYLLKRVCAYYSNSVVTLCKLPHSLQTIQLLRRWERKTKSEFPLIYKNAGSAKKLRILRLTGYLFSLFL